MVLAWGAINARHPSPDRPQVAFRVDYSGGWGAYRKPVSRGFTSVCRAYAGPPLAWFVAGCTMPDGSHWALQAWQRGLPNLGLDPWKPLQASWELRLSRWSGELPRLELSTNWAYSQAVRPPLRAPHVPRPAGLRVPRVGRRRPGRRLRPEHLRRHVQLGLRAGLEAGEQLPLAPRYGRLLLRLLPARPVPGLPGRRAPSGREGRALPGDRRRPGRAPRRDVGRAAPGAYDEALDRQLADAQRALYGADTRCKPV